MTKKAMLCGPGHPVRLVVLVPLEEKYRSTLASISESNENDEARTLRMGLMNGTPL